MLKQLIQEAEEAFDYEKLVSKAPSYEQEQINIKLFIATQITKAATEALGAVEIKSIPGYIDPESRGYNHAAEDFKSTKDKFINN
jgi:hypothetical protein